MNKSDTEQNPPEFKNERISAQVFPVLKDCSTAMLL